MASLPSDPISGLSQALDPLRPKTELRLASIGAPMIAGPLPSIQDFPANCGGKREPTSGLEPLTCSLRVIHHVLQGLARACKSRMFRLLSLLRVAACCTVLRSRWCQSGVNIKVVFLLTRNFLVPGLQPIGKALRSP